MKADDSGKYLRGKENAMNHLNTIVLFVMGTACGSLITCVSDRIIADEDWIRGRSHCDHCRHVLRPLDLIPVLSWILLKGRCRYCHEKIPVHSTVIEILTGVLFVLLYLKEKKWNPMLFRNLILVVLCMGISLIDWKKMIIPDGFIIAGIMNWLSFAFVSRDCIQYCIDGITGAILISGMVLSIALIMNRILGRESLGGGDLKLLFVISLYTGAFAGMLVLFLSCLSGLFCILAMKRDRIPFAPSICLAAYLVFLVGKEMTALF